VPTVLDAERFRKSRDAGCFVGLQPGRRNSGESEPQMHISKEGDEYLRTLLMQGAHYILGPLEKIVICGAGGRSSRREEERTPRNGRSWR